MFIDIFLRIYRLISAPSAAWKKMHDKEEAAHSLFFSRFLFPVMGLAALSCFADLFGKEFDVPNLESVLRLAIIEFVKFFVGFYLLVFIMKEVLPYFSIKKEKEQIERFAGSLLAVYMTVDIVVNILPKGFSFLEYAVLGIVYIVWTGLKIFMEVEETRLRITTLLVTILTLVVPIIVERILYIMMPGIHM